MKKYSRLLSILMIIALIVTCAPVAMAAEVTNLPLLTVDGKNLVADETTRYITLLEQDPQTKIIEATVQVENNTLSGKVLVLQGVGMTIAFNEKIAPYSLTEGEYVGGLNRDINLFKKYCEPLQARGTLTKLGTSIIQNDTNDRVIGGKISCPNEDFLLEILPGEKADIAKFYFVPVNGKDELDLDMFGFKYKEYREESIYLTSWIGNGIHLLAADNRAMTEVYTYHISNNAFKMHVKHLAPVGVAADQVNRRIKGYDASTMEWAKVEQGPYTAGVPGIDNEAQTIYVRAKGDDQYSQNDPDYKYINYKKYIASDSVAIFFDKKRVVKVEPKL